MVDLHDTAMPTASQPLGQLMVDLRGTTLTAAERQWLGHPAVGAVILFARNYRSPAQLRALTADIRAVRAPALLIAVDQEGGRVQRFRAGFRQLPAAARIGALYQRDHERGLRAAAAAGELMAAEVLRAGVDFSFAPVLDCRHPASRVIGDRAFAADPAVVAELAAAYVAGMRRAGMVATGKHFPGHGGVSGDSHAEQPVDARPRDEVCARDLQPFAALAAQLGGVMTAHVRFPAVDAYAPAWSRLWLRDILRGQLGFGGVIFSDDMSMLGATAGAETGDQLGAKCHAALAAGCDVLPVCNAPEDARRAADDLARHGLREPTGLAAMRGADAGSDTDALAAALSELGL